MQAPIIARIEALLPGKTLQPAAAYGFDPVSRVMPIRKDAPLRYLWHEGHLAGLNLAGAGLDDDTWRQILAVIEPEAAHLQAINLRDNKLTAFDLPPAMRNLRYLDLNNNQLREFAPPAEAVAQLEHLWLYGNENLATPPPEIVAQGRYAIAGYFKKRLEGVRFLREAKLLLLGESGAGKTTLALKMKKIDSPLPGKDESTRGIAVETLRIGEGDQAFDIHLWDFGGQQIYHGTHRFFLTKRSLYVVLADNRKQNTDFNYWLQMAELYGDGSPLYIVVNKTDGRPPYPNLGGMRARFDFLREMLAANLDTLGEYDKSENAAAVNTADTQKVINTLTNRICELEHVTQSLPLSWFHVRNELERIREAENINYISLDRYYTVCAAYGLNDKDRKSQLQLSAYLHDLGAILHFQDDGALRETVILRMTWATDAVFKTYDSPLVNAGDRPGFFNKRDIGQIWHDEMYVDKQEQLLALMLRFKLCYHVGETDDYIMPELLPFAQPDYAASIPSLHPDELSHAPALRYSYDFMPRGIFARLAVEVHQLIAHGQKFIWREGTILQQGDSYALITETYGNREIVVRSIGKRRRELTTQATIHLDRIHASFPRLRVQKLIPCNCPACRILQAPHYHDYEKLIEFLENGRTKTPCDNRPYHDVDIKSLLEEVFGKDVNVPATPDKKDKSSQSTPKKVFLSYSHDQIDAAKRLKTALAVQAKTGKIHFWYDQGILPGAEWKKEIENKLGEADIIVLLLSPEFWASDFIWEQELPLVAARYAAGAQVLCVMLTDNDFQETQWSGLQAVPQLKGRLTPISRWPDKDEAWQEVVKALKRMLG